MTPAAATRMRLRAMIRKESLQVLRDPSSIAIAIVLPLVLLLLFGYGVSLDAKHVRIALVVEHADANTASLTGAFQHSEYFLPVAFQNIQQAERSLEAHEVDGIVWLRNDFSSRLLLGDDAPIGVFVNGVDANQARITQGYIEGLWQSWIASYARDHGHELKMPVVLQPRIWFNPAVNSRNFLVPGLIAIIMTLTGAMLTEITVGKLVPYFVLGMGGMLLTLAMAQLLFKVPLQGSFLVLTATSALYMMVALGMGLLISSIARSQFVAGQVALVATFLPAFMLSGFIFHIGSMPEPVQIITHIVPARYFVAILQTVFMAGDIWPVLLSNSAALLLMMFLFLGIARRNARKRLD